MRQGDDAPTSRRLLRCEAAQEIRFGDHPDERGAIDDGQTANAFGDDHLRRCRYRGVRGDRDHRIGHDLFHILRALA